MINPIIMVIYRWDNLLSSNFFAMNIHRLALLLAMLASEATLAQPSVQKFSHTNLTYNYDTGAASATVIRCVLPDSSGIYSLGGFTDYYPAFLSRITLARHDYEGNLVWRRDVNTPYFVANVLSPYGLLHFDSNKKAVVGIIYDNTVADSTVVYRPFFYFFNNDGDSLRYIEPIHPPLEDRVVLAATKGKNGNILATGWWGSAKRTFMSAPGGGGYVPDSAGIYVVKYDSSGQMLWESIIDKRYGASLTSTRVLEAADGSVFVACFAYEPSVQRLAGIIMKLDAQGNLLWRRTYPRATHFPYLDSWDMALTSDGGYYFLMPGMTTPYIPNQTPLSSLFYYGRCNSNGDTLWTRLFADTGQASGYKYTSAISLSVNQRGDLVMLGSEYYDAIDHPVLVIADSVGAVRAKRQYFPYPTRPVGSMTRVLFKCAPSPYGTLAFSGAISSGQMIPGAFDSVGNYGWLMQTDSLGCLISGCNVSDTVWQPTAVAGQAMLSNTVVLYPNPTDGRVQVAGMAEGTQYTVSDAVGRALLHGSFSNTTGTLDLEDLPGGVYLVTLTARDGRRATARVVRQ